MSDETYDIVVTDTGTAEVTARFERLATAQAQATTASNSLRAAFSEIAATGGGLTAALGAANATGEALASTAGALNYAFGSLPGLLVEQEAAVGGVAASYTGLSGAIGVTSTELAGQATAAVETVSALDSLDAAAVSTSESMAALGETVTTTRSKLNIISGDIISVADEFDRMRPALGDVNKTFGDWGDNLVSVQFRTREQVAAMQAQKDALAAEAAALEANRSLWDRFTTGLGNAVARARELIPTLGGVASAAKGAAGAQDEAAGAAERHVSGMSNLRRTLQQVQLAFSTLIVVRVAEYFNSLTESTREWELALNSLTVNMGTQAEALQTVNDLSLKYGGSTKNIAEALGSVIESGNQVGTVIRSVNGAAGVLDTTTASMKGNVTDFMATMALTQPALATQNAALDAFTKANQAGTVSLQDFQAIGRATPLVLAAMTQSMPGVTGGTRQLATWARDGKLTVQDLNNAILIASKNIAGIPTPPPSASSAFGILKDAVANYATSQASATGFAGGFSQIMILLAQNLNTVIPILEAFGAVLSVIVAGQVTYYFAKIIAQLVIMGAQLAVNTALWIAANLPIIAFGVVIIGVVGALIYFADTLAKVTEGIPGLGTMFAYLKTNVDLLKTSLGGAWAEAEKAASKFKDMFTQTGLNAQQQKQYNDAMAGFNGVTPYATANASSLASATKSAGDAAGVAGLGFSNLNGQLAITVSNMGNVMSRTLVADQIFAKYGSSTNAAYDALAQFDREAGNAGYVINAFGEYVKVANDNSGAFVGTLNNVAAAAGAVSSALDGATFSTKNFQDSQGLGAPGGVGMFTITPHDGSDLGNYNNLMASLPQSFISQINWNAVPKLAESVDPGSTVRAITAIDNQYKAWLASGAGATSTTVSAAGGTPVSTGPVSTAPMALPVASTPATVATQGGTPTVNVAMTVVTPDTNGFARSTKQIAAGTKQALALAVA